MPDAFLVDWDPNDLQDQIHRVESLDWHICGTETHDPEDAARKAAETQPDVVLVWMSTGYPRSRRTALQLKTRQETEGVPIVFVDGSHQDRNKMRDVLPAAIYTDTYNLQDALRQALKQSKKVPGSKVAREAGFKVHEKPSAAEAPVKPSTGRTPRPSRRTGGLRDLAREAKKEKTEHREDIKGRRP